MPHRWRICAALAAVMLAVLVVRIVPLWAPDVEESAETLVRQRIEAQVGATLPQTPSGSERAGARERALQNWIARHPDELAAMRTAARRELLGDIRYPVGERRFIYLGDLDSYFWLRQARNYLDHGSTCDRIVDGVCRDELAIAPLGTTMRYAGSPHAIAIAWLHRLILCFDAQWPLMMSAALLPVLLGVIGVVPAFAIGYRFAGLGAAVVAALVCSLHPIYLSRSIGSDNDVWNVVLPLFALWAAIEAITRRRPLLFVACGLVLGLHSAVWRGWVFVFAVLLGAGLLDIALSLAHAWRRQGWRGIAASRDVRTATFGLLLLVTSSGLATLGLAQDGVSAFDLPGRAWLAVSSPPEPIVTELPSSLDFVAELVPPEFAAIAQAGGILPTFLACLGLLLTQLPSGNWKRRHFLVFLAGVIALRVLFGNEAMPRLWQVAVLAASLAPALLLDSRRWIGKRRAALIVIVWFLAALYQSRNGVRFLLLLVPPFAFAFAYALGHAQHWLARRAAQGRFPRLRHAAVLALLPMILPLQEGVTVAHRYVPRFHRVWDDALTHLRQATPGDAIVNAAWDFGYWIQTMAQRRTLADGAALTTRIPYWIGRAQLSPPPQALGLLRMLDCGSDALLLPGAEHAALAKLAAAGIDERRAYSIILEIAGLNRAAAAQVLVAGGLAADQAEAVLAATHCVPPPAYLLLSDHQLELMGWQRAGVWSFEERDPALPEMVTKEWAECFAEGEKMTCPLGIETAYGLVETVVYETANPRQAQFLMGDGEDGPRDAGVVLVADENGVDERPHAEADLGVLIDAARQRVLVASPLLLRSLYVRLLYLDGAGADAFVKVGAWRSSFGESLQLWAVRWPPT